VAWIGERFPGLEGHHLAYSGQEQLQLVVGPASEVAAVIVDPGARLITAPDSDLEQTAGADDPSQVRQCQVDVVAGAGA